MTTVTASNWVRVTKNNPCPICGKSDWCLTSEDGKSAICARTESDKPAGRAGWLHKLDRSNPLSPPPKPRQPARGSEKAAEDILDKAYGAMLSELHLSETHCANLKHRGLIDGEIHTLGYKSLPVNGRRTVIQKLIAQGIRLTGIPGFWVESGEIRLSGPAGMLIPVKDIKSRIVGLQIRCDSAESGSRYRWLSSRGFFAGCSPGAPVHVARKAASSNSEIWITEGPIKADIAALKLGHVVLAVPGVGNWPGVIPIIRELAPSRVIIAFDMDKLSNAVVNLHTNALIAYLVMRRIRTFEADWDAKFKGLDDLLTT